jgi:hypothetical protein
MRGFTWTTESSLDIPAPPGGDLWCLRDTFCQLMEWPPGSEDWRAFIQAPGSQDVYRLIDHLGLTLFECHQPELAEHLAHPGVLVYLLTVPGMLSSRPMAHMVYEPDLRSCRGIPPQYAENRPQLIQVIVDTRRQPGSPASLGPPRRPIGVSPADTGMGFSASGRSAWYRTALAEQPSCKRPG